MSGPQSVGLPASLQTAKANAPQVAETAISAASRDRDPAWNLSFLTPRLCRLLLLLIIAGGFVAHLNYLNYRCPVDLSGDEAQYWDWSRQLDLSYYSKGPLVAYIIRASCWAFGQESMPAVRFPALVLSAATLLVTYALTRKLFGSDRLALGVVLLYHLVPMFVAGSLLMTIDPPYFFAWGLATYLLVLAVFDGRKWAWPLVGVVAGLGFLAKYAMLLWFVPMLAFLVTDRASRRLLLGPWPWLAIGIALLFLMPVGIWNARHNWVTFRHVATQTGTGSAGHFSLANVAEFVGGQIAVVGPGVALFIFAGLLAAVRPIRSSPASASPAPNKTISADTTPPPFRQLRLLAWFGGLFFVFCLIASCRTKVQMNWPVSAYFTLTILAGWFLAGRLKSRQTWRPWRWWFWGTVLLGLIAMPLSHYSQLLFPAIRWVNRNAPAWREQKPGPLAWIGNRIPKAGLDGRTIDFASKLKGLDDLGRAVSNEVAGLGPGTFILAEDYQQSAQLAFYVRGHPKTFYAGSWYQEDPKRHTQYDIWPDRNLAATDSQGRPNPLLGRNAVFVGHTDRLFGDLTRVFDRVEGVTVVKERQVDGATVDRQETRSIDVEVVRDGITVRTFRYFRCYGFRGMTRARNEAY